LQDLFVGAQVGKQLLELLILFFVQLQTPNLCNSEATTPSN